MDDAFNTFLVAGGPALNNLAPGTYFVNATSTITNCVTARPVQIDIRDASVLPLIQLIDYINPTRCDGINTRGEMTASADGILDNALYTYTWHQGIGTTGPVLEPNDYRIQALDQGDYTIMVTHNATSCINTAAFTLSDQVVKPVLTASSLHLTSCLFDDGRMVANVINTSSDYDYFWYDGTDTTAALIYTQQDNDSVSAGVYTVVAVDRLDPFCKSRPANVYIDDRKEWPEIEIYLDDPLTNCDPSKANGQLSATVNGDYADYTFYWYDGADTTATPVHTSPIYSQLIDNTYTVQVVHRLTGCSRSASLDVPDQHIDPPPPTIEVLSDMYSCTIPNGALRATVSGNTSDFIFDWYNGNPSGTPDHSGSVYAQLDIGDYASIATDKQTGCASQPASAIISDARIYPDFEVVTENSLCIEPTGQAYINFDPQYQITGVEWNIDGTIVQGPAAYALRPGDHEVTVYGKGDCPTTETFFVGTDIYVYNGVSPNMDGLNEVFNIGCIDFFENNNVRIYNRTGQLVYEINNYDNMENAFDGIGNRGIYLDSRNVPDGTYFYVIDKRDGSKPIAGFLELIR